MLHRSTSFFLFRPGRSFLLSPCRGKSCHILNRGLW
nr:MAG TPA: hypothetical protein [Caudoviricetes sp.]